MNSNIQTTFKILKVSYESRTETVQTELTGSSFLKVQHWISMSVAESHPTPLQQPDNARSETPSLLLACCKTTHS